MVHAVGIPRSLGQIYGVLFASPRSLSFTDIVDRLEISKGSASQGIQLLLSLGAIRISEIPGAPREQSTNEGSLRRGITYEPELSLRKLVSGILMERAAPLAPGAEGLTRLKILAEADVENGAFYLDRVKQLATWRRRLKAVLPVLKTLLGPKSRKKFGES